MDLHILPPSKTRFDLKPLGIGLFKPQDPYQWNYNPTGSRLIKPGPDGFMHTARPVQTVFTTRTIIRPELVTVLHSGFNALVTHGSKTGI